jgi:phospholipid transport system substrate-binding protein
MPMVSRHRLAIAVSILLTLAGTVPARAGDPGAQLTEQIAQVFKTLDDPALKSTDKEGERRVAVRRIVDDGFDFGETARRALGRHWEDRSAAERERFVQLFSGLIDRAYLRRVDKLDGEQIVLVGSAVNGDDATVQTRVVTRDKSQMPVEFVMLRTPADRWRVWDVRVGGMSLVGSYRAQFHKIIVAESYDALVRRLESKVAGEP